MKMKKNAKSRLEMELEMSFWVGIIISGCVQYIFTYSSSPFSGLDIELLVVLTRRKYMVESQVP